MSILAATLLTSVFTGAEVKISYPCAVIDKLSKEKEEIQAITFYEADQNILYRQGYIIRKRAPVDNDLTIKYRSVDGKFEMDESIYSSLSTSSNGELKCELDLTYDSTHFKTTKSCSFKTNGANLIGEHLAFAKMLNRPIVGWNQSLASLHQLNVESRGWKIKLSPEQKKQSPLDKKPAVEMWFKGQECKLEVSGKFAIQGLSEAQITQKALKSFTFLKGLVAAHPSEEQGNKTAWALGLK